MLNMDVNVFTDRAFSILICCAHLFVRKSSTSAFRI